jgi:hypothetical protein
MKIGAGAGLLFISPLGEHMRYVVRLHFPASNNMAEYEALLRGLRIAIETGVGDSHKGPLNNQGETRLKPAKNSKHKSTCTPKTHTQHNHDPGGPRGPPVQRSGRPSSEVRLARGIDAPSGGVHLARGLHAPSGGSASLEGSTPPLERGPPRSRAERPLGRGPLCSRAPTRTFSTLLRAPVSARAYEHLML